MTVPAIGLNDENTIPALGLGVGELSEAEAERAVATALEIGYRLIDTAASYGNEAAVGRAIRESGIPRAEIFVTTKLANADQGFGSSRDALQASLERLGLDYVDLYLIHWPLAEQGKFIDSFAGILKAREDGLVKSAGVANFTPENLTDLIDLTYVAPAVNQIELHPLLTQTALRAAHAEHNIHTQAYSPLGVGNLLTDETVTAVAAEYGRSPAQVLLRWNLQLGNSVIARSSSAERIAENFDVFKASDVERLSALDNGTRFRPDPETYSGV
jgi:2,5-diketo-D-gluconate reductase A